ncbi:MAG: hypothetical protein ACR2JW_15440 [Thermomicrobiales bacterium]
MQSPFRTPVGRLTRPRYRRQRDSAPVVPGRAPRPEVALYIEEAVTRRLVEDVIDEVRDMRDRMMNLLFLIAGSVLIDVLTRIGGR